MIFQDYDLHDLVVYDIVRDEKTLKIFVCCDNPGVNTRYIIHIDGVDFDCRFYCLKRFPRFHNPPN